MDSNAHKPSFWTTLPGILTGIAAIVGSMTGLLGAIGYFHQPIGTHLDPNNDRKMEPIINNNPISNAGLNRTINEGYVVHLDGSKSYDPDGNPITYSWRQFEGPVVELDYATTAIPSFISPNVSTNTKLVFELIVKDNKGASSNPSIVTLIVEPFSTTHSELGNIKTLKTDIKNLTSNMSDKNGAENNHSSSSGSSSAQSRNGGNMSSMALGNMTSGSNGSSNSESNFQNTSNSGSSASTDNTIFSNASIQDSDINRLIDKGNSFYNSSMYDTAKTYYDKALSIDPNNTGALDNKGIALNGLGNYTGAITYYDKALSIDPNYEVALYNKGTTLDNLGNYTGAITYYDKALSIDPNDKLALYNKANSLEKLNNENKNINTSIQNTSNSGSSASTDNTIFSNASMPLNEQTGGSGNMTSMNMTDISEGNMTMASPNTSMPLNEQTGGSGDTSKMIDENFSEKLLNYTNNAIIAFKDKKKSAAFDNLQIIQQDLIKANAIGTSNQNNKLNIAELLDNTNSAIKGLIDNKKSAVNNNLMILQDALINALGKQVTVLPDSNN